MSLPRRLEAFSDGVFAIAITLLVLETPVPSVDQGGLADALLDQWPVYAAYVVSFAIIGIIWINHHSVFGYIERVDRGLLFLNLNLLLWVALIPWPTSLLAEYMQSGGSDERAAALVYASTMTLMGASFGGMWLYIAHRPGVGAVSRLQPAEVRARTRRFVVGAPLCPFHRPRIGECASLPGRQRSVSRLLRIARRRSDGASRRHVEARVR